MCGPSGEPPVGSTYDALAFDWSSPPADLPKIDVVIAADVVWLADLVDIFVGACKFLRESNPDAIFILAHQTRSQGTDDKFFDG